MFKTPVPAFTVEWINSSNGDRIKIASNSLRCIINLRTGMIATHSCYIKYVREYVTRYQRL